MPKTVISFNYPCYICGYIFSKSTGVIDHIQRIHGYELPKRLRGHKRPQDPEYSYQTNPNDHFDTQHHACSSCWYHCSESNLQDLAEHIIKKHHPNNVDPSKNDHGNQPKVYPKKAIRPDEQQAEDINKEEHTSQDEMEVDGQRQNSSIEASDVMRKLNELTDLFKKLLQ